MKIISINQQIDGHFLKYQVLAEGEKPLQYAFVEKRNGLIINRTEFTDCPEGTLDMSEKGCYQIESRVRDSEGQSICAAAPYIYFLPLNVHVYGDAFTIDWLDSVQKKRIVCVDKCLNRLSLYPIFRLNKKASNDTVLIMDFVKTAEKFAVKHSSFLKEIRSKTERSIVAELREKHAPLNNFIRKVQDTLKAALALYGSENVFLLSPICDFTHADERTLNLNYVLEEVDYVALKMEGINRLLMANCIPKKENGELIAREEDTINAEKILHKAAIKKYVGVIGFPQLELTLDDNKLRAHYISKLPPQACWIRLDLVRDDIRLDHQVNPEGQSYTWTLTEPGTYIVRVHVTYAGQSTYRQSLPYAYYPEKDMHDYRSFLIQDTKPKTLIGQGDISLRDAPATMPDFLFLSCKGRKVAEINKEKLPPVEVNKSFSWIDLPAIGDWHSLVLTNGKLLNTNEGQLLFSGETVLRGVFIEGAEELPLDVKVEELLGKTGPYALMAHNSQSIILSRDFNNYFQLYYYEKDDISLISPSYHLLLLGMSACGIQGELDEKKAGVTLSIPGNQMLMANYSCRMDIKGVLQLPVFKDLVLTEEDGWRSVDNLCYQILSSKETYHEELYRSMIKIINQEIRDYVRATFAHPKCKHIILNLTGGIDSRYLLSLIMGIELEKPLYVNSHPDGKGNLDDVLYATMLNSLYGFPYYDLPVTIEFIEPYHADQWFRSEFMGRTWEYPDQVEKDRFSLINDDGWSFTRQVEEDRYTIIGGGGASLTRPVYGKHCFKAMENREESIYNILECYIERFTHNLIAGKEAFSSILDYLCEDIYLMPYGSGFESLETHFFMHKNALHFGTFLLDKYRHMPILIPMQSSQMFRIKHMTYDRFRSMKMMFDLVTDANPSLSAISYNHEEYNMAYKELDHTLIKVHEDYNEKITAAKEDLHAWEEANKRRNNNRRYLQGEEDRREIRGLIDKIPEERYEALLCNSRELLKRSPKLEKRLGKALYHYVKNNRANKREMVMLYNKVTNLLDQLRIFENNI